MVRSVCMAGFVLSRTSEIVPLALQVYSKQLDSFRARINMSALDQQALLQRLLAACMALAFYEVMISLRA